MYRVHHFASSLEAYEASLEEGPVRESDLLVIASEGVVGIASTDRRLFTLICVLHIKG